MNPEHTTAEVLGVAAPSFMQWWEHLRRNGVIAAASQKMSATQVAEMAATTYAEALARLERQTELATLAEVAAHPYGDA